MKLLIIVLIVIQLLCGVVIGNISTDLASDLFGDTLYRWESDKVVEESTANLLSDKKIIGVYFSASWCGPCRQFTPVLAKFYNEMKKKGKKFEIIWVSRDRSPQEFLEYYSKMPWLAVTWENFQTIGQKLAGKYQMRGIPHFVMLDGEDEYSIITTDGRTRVLKDPYGLEFPWKPRTLLALVPKPIKKFVYTKVNIIFRSVLHTLQGLTHGIAPAKILDFIKNKTISLLKSMSKNGIKVFSQIGVNCARQIHGMLQQYGILKNNNNHNNGIHNEDMNLDLDLVPDDQLMEMS